ncbi:phosphatidylinositol 4-kinase beta 1 isoform X2 [Canna indica]|uniref:1-phosphatidylinositol 4-kinase n=1 Tax=Canna indica TaxID=4628 RepID=A0AAQ3Q9G3_9LILI|nr:phosphatidylinositol 4-kinase beta 1 isoform X2 [Canna indica]
MVRLLSLRSFGLDPSPREITPPVPVSGQGSGGGNGEKGWLIRFFDSAFFCEWIAVSYLYKHDHDGVRDYLCNRMYTLPLHGIESYLFQICYMLVYKPSPSLDKFVIDTCSKALTIALKVHWFLMAELEDSEDSEGISRIQEKCQIAATLMGEWPPLLCPPPPPSNPSSPRSNIVLNRILSSKQKLMSLASSQTLGSSPLIDENSRGNSSSDGNSNGLGSPEENNPSSPKSNIVLNRIFSSKQKLMSLASSQTLGSSPLIDENSRGNSSSDGNNKGLGSPEENNPSSPRSNIVLNRILSSKQKLMSLASSQTLGSCPLIDENSRGNSSSDGNSKGLGSPQENNLLKKLIPGPKVRDALLFRKSLEKEGEESERDGFLKRLLRDSKDKDEDVDKDGFFRRLMRDNKDEEGLTASSEGFLKRLFRDKEEKLGEDDDKEGFFRRIFKDKSEEKKDGGHDKNEYEEKANDNTELEEKENFFRRLFKDKHEDRKDGIYERNKEKDKANGSVDEAEKESFLRRIFKDKNEEKNENVHGRNEDREKVNESYEEDDKDNIFRRLFKDKNEEKKDGGHSRDEKEKSKKSLEDDNVFHRLFKDKTEVKVVGHGKHDTDKCNGIIEEGEKDNFFRRLFKDKHDEKKVEGHVQNEEDSQHSEIFEEEETSEILSFRRLFRVHPEEQKASSTNENGTFENSPGTENFFRRLFRDRDRSIEDSELLGSRIQKEKCPGSPRQRNENLFGKPPLPNNVVSEIRKGSYHASLEFVQSLCDTSYGLVDIYPIEDRKIALRESLTEINSHVAEAEKNGGVCFPMGNGMYRVIHIPEDEAVLLNSREKAPYLICVEVLKCETPSHTKMASDAQKLSRAGIPLANGDAQLPRPPPWAYPLWSKKDIHHYDAGGVLKSTSQAIDEAMAQLWEAKKSQHAMVNGEDLAGKSTSNSDQVPEWITVNLSAIPGVNMEDVEDQEPSRPKDHRRVPSTIAIEEVKAAAAKGQAPPGLSFKTTGQNSQTAEPKVMNGGVPKPSDALSGELWDLKKQRIQKSSAYGKLPGWDLRSIIVKSGDDCRQEHLAVQLVSHFFDIYQEAGLPLWLRPYEVLVTSSYTALIETIPDTASIHSIKSRFPNISSLRDYFAAKYEENSPNFKLAQRNFVESMAGYSILCYLLQVKDRHNGNILLDEEGHIIHIDFGFMLSNSPGGVNFESAPFKLTRELLEVMDSDAEGTPSEFFDYFKVLCIQGFLTCRKHAERIILLVEMLQDSGFPCFKGGSRTIQNLRKRSLFNHQDFHAAMCLLGTLLDQQQLRCMANTTV